MIREQSIVCFANDWNADPTSKHQLMRRFAPANRVLWIESPGMRAPRLSQGKDLRRIGAKLRTLGRQAEERLPNLHVCAPPTLPFPASAVARSVVNSCDRGLRAAAVSISASAWPASRLFESAKARSHTTLASCGARR